MLLVAVAARWRLPLAGPGMEDLMTVSPEQVSRVHREAPMTDAHVHPSLKAYIFRRNLWRHWWSGGAFDPFSSRSDFEMLAKGEVGVIWSAIYVPEHPLFDRCVLLKAAAHLVSPVARKLTSGSYFERAIAMMDAMEGEIRRKPSWTGLAHSPADVKDLAAEGKIAVVHTVEGGHVLEGRIENLEELHRRGVAVLTLTHFFPNGIADPVDAIPKNMWIRNICTKLGPPDPVPPGLSDFGKEVLRRMKELGMIVDVTHCTPGARAEVYAELGTDVPIVASHVGADELHPTVYNLKRHEIEHIAASGGAVGIIFMNYWLGHLEPDPVNLDAGLGNIWLTAKYIHDVTGGWDHVMLGTDFDGFTDPPNDLRDSSQMPRVTEMLFRNGVAEEDVRKILGGNAQRVLDLGWR
ncbi:MAG: dipeptidase [Gemmatimonadales bacterium]